MNLAQQGSEFCGIFNILYVCTLTFLHNIKASKVSKLYSLNASTPDLMYIILFIIIYGFSTEIAIWNQSVTMIT